MELSRALHSAYDDVKDSLQRYLEDVAASQPLSSEEEIELARRIKLGDLNARTKLVEANLRFVISVAREYQNQGVPLADLISAGNIGLITAAERFDETKGFKFISYAVWWIRQAVLQTLAEHSRVVRLPLNRVDLLRRISRFSSDRQQETSQRPAEEEIAEELGISVDQVMETLASGQRILSLDATFDDNDENSLMEIMADSRQEPPDALLMRNSLEEEIEMALGTLEKREAEVVRLYFGLGGVNEMTLEEIGVKFGLTRERVRQIKEKALRKLRHPTRGKKLIPYAEEI
ncbi:MAG: RNA polymerase sigma factor RpoD/SigA [Candidatus Latescibacteria bacterium]|nr:RNA polymerase sigma factor RpoD/SigA [Candidatus Latescibacterota bacterium]